MALIKCVECGKDISDKSEVCIHCGCPTSISIEEIKKVENEKIAERERNKDKLFYECPICKVKYPDGIIHCDVCGYDALGNYTYTTTEKSVPTCPRCGSTSITTGARGVNGLFGFVGASKTVNRCASCGNTWTPKR